MLKCESRFTIENKTNTECIDSDSKKFTMASRRDQGGSEKGSAVTPGSSHSKGRKIRSVEAGTRFCGGAYVTGTFSAINLALT